MLLVLVIAMLNYGCAENVTKIIVGRDEKTRAFEERTGEERMNSLPLEERTLLRFVLDFAIHNEWDQIVLFAPVSSAWLKPYAASICGYFNGYGKYIAIHSTVHSLLPQSLDHNRHRVGVVLFWDPTMDDFFAELSKLDVFNEYRTWLFLRRENHKGMNITEKLTDLNFGIDTNAVICRAERQIIPTKIPKVSTTFMDDTEDDNNERICRPEDENEDWYKEFCTTGISRTRTKRQIKIDPQLVVGLYQVYKVSRSDFGSIVQNHIGYWDAANGLANCEEMTPVEKRLFLHRFKVVIGVRNFTNEVSGSNGQDFSMESDEDEAMHMREVLECLLYGLNVSREIVQFQKLGLSNEEGGYTHMLGAVVDGTIDFALITMRVTKNALQEMAFTHPILKTMNNVYFKRPDSGGMRDIFLAPFSPSLLFCVFSTAILLAFAMISIAIVNWKIVRGDKRLVQSSVTKVETDERKWEVSEAALWSVSVMCMQGSSWCPTSKSGSLLLICGLLFALVIHNAYAAFITSVLSVKTASIKNLDDLLHSNFAFGYIEGATDEFFLRTVNDSLLRELYFKGLRKKDGVKDPTTGMYRTGEGNYAFFVPARFARRALRKGVAHSQRCGIQELTLPITRTVAAIPMSKNSAIKKILNFRVLRMMEAGIFHRFQGLILPPMPKCVERTTFNSARITDVYSAFYMIVIGWIISCSLFLGEVVWHKRKIRRGQPKHEHHHHFHFMDNAIVKSIRMHDFHWPRMHN